ncbi:hypothetical protein F2Q70_00026966 [Brassica cretica]|uniref:Uncharacterized protein n=1 Tax=Brassica cretica TaxID=69181 RepID=A0A8S9LBI1_BRACR|nr:hypothetical protein F2Q68_00026484 [Brassica cretica]KAF2602903.1 hypothetical protein F2Q70_00026966 [Brassica cretica]
MGWLRGEIDLSDYPSTERSSFSIGCSQVQSCITFSTHCLTHKALTGKKEVNSAKRLHRKRTQLGDMGKMLRMWRGEWRKNDSQYWHFVPEQTDFGLSLYMDEGESFATVERIVRTRNGVSETTPMVITVGWPVL